MTDKEIAQKICRNVKYLCLLRGLKLGEVEKTIGVSRGYFSRTGKGVSGFPIQKAVKIAEYFDIPVEFLIAVDYKKQYHEQELKRIESEG